MARSLRLAFGCVVASLAGLAPAAEPLVKPATIPVGATRLRFPLESDNGSAYRLKALIPPPKTAKKGTEPLPATIAIDTALGDTGYITVKKLKSFGYDVPVGQTAILPEVLLLGETVGPKPKAGEVRAKANNLKLVVLEKAYGSEDTVGGADLQVNLDVLLQGTAAQSQAWVYFGKTLLMDANYPEKSLIRPPTEAGATPTEFVPEEPTADRVPMMITLRTGYQMPLNGFHGKPAATGPRVVFSLGQIREPGIYVTAKMAKMYELKPDPDAKELEIFADFNKKGKAMMGLIKDIRIPVGIDAGFKTARELTSKEQPLILDQEQQTPALYVGPGYFGPLLQNPIMAVGPDGVARVYGYIEPKSVPVAPKKKP